jgi:hypothetical protein
MRFLRVGRLQISWVWCQNQIVPPRPAPPPLPIDLHGRRFGYVSGR